MAATVTGADGRFRLTGIGRDRQVSLAADGPSIAHQGILIATRPAAAPPASGQVRGSDCEIRARPGRPICGVVRDKSTGKPVAGAAVTAGPGSQAVLTGPDGRFELLGGSDPLATTVHVQPPPGEPYFGASVRLAASPPGGPVRAEIDLVGGIRLQGRVVVDRAGKLPKRAVVE